MPPDYQTLPSRNVSLARIGVLAVLLVGLIILIWLVFFHHSSPSTASTGKSPSTSQTHKSPPKTPQPTSSASSASQPKPAKPTTSSGSAATPAPTIAPAAGSQPLTNTGPGNTIALFVTAAGIGTIIGHLYFRRRTASKR